MGFSHEFLTTDYGKAFCNATEKMVTFFKGIYTALIDRCMFDVRNMWRLATRESADFQKQSTDFQLTARLFTHSAENICLAPREQQVKHAAGNDTL